MLIMGETPKDRKKWLLELIKTNKRFIGRIDALKPTESALKQQTKTLRAEIKSYMKELIELERWRKREGYKVDQPYLPPSFKKYLEDMDEDSKLAYAEWQADLQKEIDRLTEGMTDGKE